MVLVRQFCISCTCCCLFLFKGSWIYTLKRIQQLNQNTAQDQSALVFSSATYKGGYYDM